MLLRQLKYAASSNKELTSLIKRRNRMIPNKFNVVCYHNN